MRIRVIFIPGLFLLALSLSLSACPPEMPPASTITVESDVVTVNNTGIDTGTSTQAVPNEALVETDSSGKATMDFQVRGKLANGVINTKNTTATKLMVRPVPDFPEILFYLYYGVAHFGWDGKGTVSCSVSQYAEVTSSEPLVRFIVDPQNPQEEIQIAVYYGSVNVTIQEEKWEISANEELVFNSQTGKVDIRTPKFDALEEQAFSKIATRLNIPLPPEYPLTIPAGNVTPGPTVTTD